MNDAFERRALLQQLGSVLEMLTTVKEHEYEVQLVGELIRKYPSLAQMALLDHVAQTMPLRELEQRALHAFYRWPALLLEERLDRSALASPVREWLFDHYEFGWESYAAALSADVPWFSEAVADTTT
ncbi:hypothetical protein F4827_006790 [Paraburkholderia bannensis]|uniref:Uncharacterized protein n=1 Tax=Paraburkholderia bannensis TaxID=765414 RepID=A0A7W9U5Y7_9BURK|nr:MULTISPECIES: hypothetical protein [Paraburkholderia]MBB3261916.1 hypothetical protein [Paraburkholderia sp. WP4_3_2]MBB6106911.1 hypothetical protein [Paraburkholderia bannensis]